MNTKLGYPELDGILGPQGLPPGRVIEIFGEEGSGKTTVALKTIAMAQLEGKVCLYIDTERSFDPKYATSLGVNMDTCIVQTPQMGTDAFVAIKDFIAQDAVDLIIIDSIAGLCTEENYTDYLTEWISMQLYSLVGPLGKSRACMICLNQLRTDPRTRRETSPGTRALSTVAVVRIQLEKHGQHKRTATVLKNRLAPTIGEVQFTL